MNSEEAYKTFTNLITAKESLEIKTGKGGLSYYKNGVFVCHFNAQPQKKRDDLGFADFRYDALRPYLDIEKTLYEIEKEAMPEVQIKNHKLWSTLHFPLTLMEHVAELFSKHIISKVNLRLKVRK
ncbi:MAG: hypothetical protein JNJ43_19255 [Anaerolineales bacterium]|nr:hypothetical protein [Anaerolineales bacterium]